MVAQDGMQRERPCCLIFSSLGVKKLESLVNRALNVSLLDRASWFLSDHKADIRRLADLMSVMANCLSKQTLQSISQRSMSYSLTYRDQEATFETRTSKVLNADQSQSSVVPMLKDARYFVPATKAYLLWITP